MVERQVLDEAIRKHDQVRVQASQSGDEPYELGADSLPQPETPQGSVTEYRLDDSQTFPGTKRRYWVYVPAQYTPDHPANLMVFQDGYRYLRPDVNAHVVFDNLIHRGEMPTCVGVFVEPGDRGPGIPIWGGDTNRNVEYDTPSDAYGQFLLDELLPRLPVAVTDDPTRRAICGMSSGGICAFTAAWERPDAFGNAVSHCGSFVNIFGGHEYSRRARSERYRDRTARRHDSSSSDPPCRRTPTRSESQVSPVTSSSTQRSSGSPRPSTQAPDPSSRFSSTKRTRQTARNDAALGAA